MSGVFTWREMIESEMADRGDSWANIVGAVGDLDVPFDNGFGCTEGPAFTVWTDDFVYFPACYDGAEWVASVSRNPDGRPTNHVGGG